MREGLGRGGGVTLVHETGFLHIRGTKIFGYEIVIRRNQRKFQNSRKNNIVALIISIEKSPVSQWMTRIVVIIIKRRIEFSNLDSLKVFSMYLGGNCSWVGLCQLSPKASTFFTHIFFFFSFTLGHFAMF